MHPLIGLSRKECVASTQIELTNVSFVNDLVGSLLTCCCMCIVSIYYTHSLTHTVLFYRNTRDGPIWIRSEQDSVIHVNGLPVYRDALRRSLAHALSPMLMTSDRFWPQHYDPQIPCEIRIPRHSDCPWDVYYSSSRKSTRVVEARSSVWCITERDSRHCLQDDWHVWRKQVSDDRQRLRR